MQHPHHMQAARQPGQLGIAHQHTGLDAGDVVARAVDDRRPQYCRVTLTLGPADRHGFAGSPLKISRL
jgi:hypothetical protein